MSKDVNNQQFHVKELVNHKVESLITCTKLIIVKKKFAF